MKVFMVDNNRKTKKIKRELEEKYSIEIKENCNFKMTKNDYAIVSDEEGMLEGLDKLKNIIMIVNDKDYKYIWNLANNYKTVDIVSNDETVEYTIKRIEKVIGREL